MTATPIPRTLALTYFGDMDVSVLDEKPAGRKPIATKVISIERLDEVVGGIGRAIENGDQVYWVCPLVGESENRSTLRRPKSVTSSCDRSSATSSVSFTASSLAATRTPRWSVSRQAKPGSLFRRPSSKSASTCPMPSIMVIEHAERFGLAQLHQLRGRIGRGSRASTCLLLYKGPLGQTAQARLEMMRESEDGFRIAEEDLRLRGRRRGAGHAAIRASRLQACTAGIGRRPAIRRPRRRTSDRRARPRSDQRRAARPCECCSICSSAMPRSGCYGRGKSPSGGPHFAGSSFETSLAPG